METNVGQLGFAGMDADLRTELLLSAALDLAFYALIDRGGFEWFSRRYPRSDRDYVLHTVTQKLER
jgi:hypothetical protein